MPNPLPVEILRLIILTATSTHNALETSPAFLDIEDKQVLSREISASLLLKASLCLVSEAFRLMTEEYSTLR